MTGWMASATQRTAEESATVDVALQIWPMQASGRAGRQEGRKAYHCSRIASKALPPGATDRHKRTHAHARAGGRSVGQDRRQQRRQNCFPSSIGFLNDLLEQRQIVSLLVAMEG
jgi:hypothetical protein